jgi:hypothetical protein
MVTDGIDGIVVDFRDGNSTIVLVQGSLLSVQTMQADVVGVVDTMINSLYSIFSHLHFFPLNSHRTIVETRNKTIHKPYHSMITVIA